MLAKGLSPLEVPSLGLSGGPVGVADGSSPNTNCPEDPHDFIARHLLRSAGHLTHGTTLFAAVYLLSHGLAKVILVVAVLREHLGPTPA